MISNVPKKIQLKYNHDIIGFIIVKDIKIFLIGAYKNKANVEDAASLFTGVTLLAIRCHKCGKIVDKVPMPKYIFGIDTNDTHVMLSSLKIDMVFAPDMCTPCEEQLMSKVCAPVYCKTCKQLISWLPPQVEHGFEIKIGKKYHVEKCNKCDPFLKNVLIEYTKFQETACK